MRPHVLIVGAGGVFGSRLSRLLARKAAFRVSLGGRNAETLKALQQELRALDFDGDYNFAALDRDRVTPEDLRRTGCTIVVDCAGPFQVSGPNLIEAAIAAGCHYVDLADSRKFVGDIGRFDARAKAAGIAVITGASSTPALSNAALDALLAGWRSIDTLDCAIVPGNQTPKGRSVIDGILSWVGQKVPVWREGEWQNGRGWTDGRWVELTGLTRRRALLAEVPDLDILPARWKPRLRAGFHAGMELRLLNMLIGLAGLPVRWHLVPSARIFTGLGTAIANALDRFGSTEGGMVIDATGEDRDGRGAGARWQLRAGDGDGPYVPVGPAAAMVHRLAFGPPVPPGARSAAGLLGIGEIIPWYAGLAIRVSSQAFHQKASLYQRILGPDFDTMPEATKRLHRGLPAIIAQGEATVEPAQNPFGRLLAFCLGMPVRSGMHPMRVIIEQRDGREHWTRFFDGRPMRSVMRKSEGLIEERFGSFRIRMQLAARTDGLDMHLVDGRLIGVPIPKILLPRIRAEERVDAKGRHLFDVEISLPLLGRIVAYRGHLGV